MFGGLFLIIPAAIFLALTAGITIVAIAFWLRRPRNQTAAVVFSFIAALFWLPILLIAFSIIQTNLARMTDTQLFKHVMDFNSGLPESEMMFDDHGDPTDGEIFMRVSPDEPLRAKILALGGYTKSAKTPSEFHSMGQDAGLLWWDNSHCSNATIYEAVDGKTKWREAYLLDCSELNEIYGVFRE